MSLNPKAAEFHPRWESYYTSEGLDRESQGDIGAGFKSKYINIPLPEDPFAPEYDDVRCTCVFRLCDADVPVDSTFSRHCYFLVVDCHLS